MKFLTLSFLLGLVLFTGCSAVSDSVNDFAGTELIQEKDEEQTPSTEQEVFSDFEDTDDQVELGDLI